MSNTMFPITIGCLSIYKDEYNAAQDIIRCVDSDKNPVMLIAQPQQGKTGAMICFIDHSIRFANANKTNIEIVWITNVSNNSLVEQTITRMRQAGLSNKVKVVHRSRLKTLRLDQNVDRRIIICDECHEAVKSDSNFIEFMNSIGVYYGKPKSTWTCKNTVVVSVSATPFAHILKNILTQQKQKPYEEQIFHEIVMPVSDIYYSIQDIKDACRFHQSGKFFKKNKPTDFFKYALDTFVESCENDGAGYLVIRASGDKNVNKIDNYIRTNYPNVDVIQYDSHKNNISSVNLDLQSQIPIPCVMIIRGALRVGQTLKTTKNIRGWIEPEGSNADTMAQALRCLGYEMVDGKNRRFEDKFPIYCNTKEIDDIIQFYDERDCNRSVVPSGVGNKSSCKSERNWFLYPIMDIDYGNRKTKPSFNEVKELLSNLDFDLNGKNELGFHSVSKNNITDLASVLNKADGFQQQYATKINVYEVDSANENFQQSWNTLQSERPEFIGKFVVAFFTEDRVSNLSNELIDMKSCFYEKSH